MSFFGSVGGLHEFLSANNNSAAVIVNKISYTWLGRFGGVLAIIGVIIAPITSGDTAFRSARLIVADFIRYNQKKIGKRLIISVPLFIMSIMLLQVNFDVIWRYFAWSNQTLAAFTLWSITVYLAMKKRFYWLSLLPSLFMTMVVSTYIVVAPEMLGLSTGVGYLVGAACTVAAGAVFVWWKIKYDKISSPE
jgi:carbon starvation protein CstA